MPSKKPARRTQRPPVAVTESADVLRTAKGSAPALDGSTARALVDALAAQIAIVDASGRILAVNARWREFAKKNRGSLVAVGEGANYLAVCDRAARRKSPGAAEVAAGIRSVLKGKTPEFAAEYPCHAPAEERWFIVRVTPFPREGARRVVVAHENITARVLAEQAVRREQEFSDRVIHTVQTIVLLLSPEGKIVRFNRRFEELTGWSLEEARGRDWFDTFLPARDRARIRKLFRGALRGPRTQGNINAIVTKDGTELEIEWDDAPLKDAEGRLVVLLCSGRDITERRRAEAALRESEERYRLLVHALPVAVFSCDAEGRILLYNAAAANLWGREPNLRRDRWGGAYRLFTADGRRLARTRRPMVSAVRQGEPIRDMELIIERPDGSRSHVLTFADPFYDAAGAVRGAVNVLVDVTALKAAETALRTSERKLRTLSQLVEQSPASVLITDSSGNIDYVNPAFTALTGHALGAVRGKNPRLLKSEAHPPAFYRELWATILAGRGWRGELCNRKKNGELFWAYAVISPILDEEGAITHFMEIMEDTTAGRSARAALHDSKERLRAILNTVTDAVVTTDRSGTITGVNPAAEQMFGWVGAQMVGQDVSLFTPLAEEGKLARRSARAGWAELAGQRREMQARRKDGATFPIELSVSEVDHMHIFTGVIRDITERKRLETEVLHIAGEERQRVAADLHDGICQELVGIQYLTMQLLRDLKKAGHPLEGQAARIEQAIIQATEHSRQVARGLSPVVEDGSGLMHALREFAETTASARGIQCVFHCPEPVLIENQTVANELYRIAQEAVTNALRHGHARRITVRLSRADGGVRLAVLDNGCGMPADVSHAQGMGLRVMQYRASLIGGKLAVQRRRSGGTEVLCRVEKIAASR